MSQPTNGNPTQPPPSGPPNDPPPSGPKAVAGALALLLAVLMGLAACQPGTPRGAQESPHPLRTARQHAP